MLQEFTAEIEKTAKEATNDIHSALPGEIISFDPNTGMAAVKPVGKYVTSNGIKLDYPVITEAPVVFPYCSSGGIGVAFPVNKGDSCMIIISEVELDSWRSGAEAEGSLRFDLTNAMVIPGLLEGGGELIAEAANSNAVVVGTSGAKVIVGDAVEVKAGSATLSISEGIITAGCDLKVNGNIIYTGTCQNG